MEPDARAQVELERLLARPEYAGVYTSPWWDVPVAAPSATRLRAWKKAVLRRRELGGAEHWGHLFLVDGESGATVDLNEERLFGERSAGASPNVERLAVGGEAGHVTLLVRPRAAATRDALLGLARELAAALAR